jgi:hypothetical protein
MAMVVLPSQSDRPAICRLNDLPFVRLFPQGGEEYDGDFIANRQGVA